MAPVCCTAGGEGKGWRRDVPQASRHRRTRRRHAADVGCGLGRSFDTPATPAGSYLRPMNMQHHPPPSPETVETWLREESSGLRALARGLLRDESDRDDVVQDTWVAALQSHPHRPGPWLRVVAKRLAFRRARRESRLRRRENVAARPEATPSASDVAEGLDLRRRVVEAVAALPEPYRSAIVLRYFHDRSPAEIAEIQGVPVATAKTRLHRALVRLRASLDEESGGSRAAWQAPLLGLVDSSTWGATTTAQLVAAGGVILAMKKYVILGLLVLFLGGSGIAIWRLAVEPTEPQAARESKDDLAAAAPTLMGQQTDLPPAPLEGDTWVLRDGDVVPDATFAGRVVDEGGAGVGGASVKLYWYADRQNPQGAQGYNPLIRRELDRRAAPSSTTNAEGYFRLDRPYSSQSFVRVDAEGFVTALAYGLSGHFVLVQLKREDVLTVRVLTEEGAPVRGAEVRLVSRWDFGGHPSHARQVLASASTDGGGQVHLPTASANQFGLEVLPTEPSLGIVQLKSIENGSRVVDVRVPSVTTHRRRVIDADTGLPVASAYVDVLHAFYGFATYSVDLFRRRIPADRDGNLMIPIQHGTSDVVSAPGYEVARTWSSDPIQLARAMRIEGTISSADGLPVADAAALLVIPGSLPYEAAYIGASPVAAFSDSQGRFDMEVKQGWRAFGEHRPDRGLRALLVAHPDQPAVAVEPSIAVVPGTRVQLDVRFPAPAAIDVYVVDTDRKPIEGKYAFSHLLLPWPETWPAPKEANGVNLTELLRTQWGETTDAQGRMRLHGLPPGRHQLSVGNARAEVQLVAGETARVQIVLGGGPSITGQIVDSVGEPVADLNVQLGGPRAGSERSDEDGRFRFDDLPEGEYQVYVSSPVLGARRRVSAPARPGDDVILRIPAGLARLRLHVDGVPVEAAEFSLLTSTGGYLANEDESTRSRTSFIAIPDLPYETGEFIPGPGYLMMRAKDLGLRIVSFDAPELTTTDLTIRFAVPGEVEGSVLVPSGAEHESILLVRTWTDADPSTQRWIHNGAQTSGRVAEDRTFRIPHVQPGAYTIKFMKYDGGSWTYGAPMHIDVRPGETTRIDLGL